MSGGIPLAYVVGTGRCGSTLVHDVLCRHSQVGFLSNLEARLPWLGFKGRFNSQIYRHLPISVAGLTSPGNRPGWGGAPHGGAPQRKAELRITHHFSPTEGWELLAKQVDRRFSRPSRDLTEEDARSEMGQRYRAFVVEHAQAQAPRLFTQHLTGWPRTRFVTTLFPASRFVNVVRDGRAVAASLIRMPWWTGPLGRPTWGISSIPDHYLEVWRASQENPLFLAAAQWATLTDAFDEARRFVPAANWLDVRYEDLISDPERYLRDIVGFLGLPWDADFERQFRRLTFAQGRTSPDLGELSTSDRAKLDKVLGSHLSKLGYVL